MWNTRVLGPPRVALYKVFPAFVAAPAPLCCIAFNAFQTLAGVALGTRLLRRPLPGFCRRHFRSRVQVAMGVEGSADSDGKAPQTAAQGELFLYNEDFGYAAFEVSGGGAGTRALVCIGGLTDGLLSLRYLPTLAEVVSSHKAGSWRVVQPVLQSSYRGWGTGSLDEDVEDIDRLLSYLSSHRGIFEVALLGHSTGCQDVVRYLAVGKHSSMVKAVILQAPVSDREALLLTNTGSSDGVDTSFTQYCELAAQMVSDGRGDEVMPRAASLLIGPPHAISAYRFNSLTGCMTDDDMFSSDLTDSELQRRLGHICVPTLVVVSVDDEYVPPTVDCRTLAARMADAMAVGPLGQAEVLAIEQGGHALRTPSATQQFVDKVQRFLGLLGQPGQRSLSWEIAMAKDIQRWASEVAGGRPLMVALVGMPGSGKTTAANAIGRLIGSDCVVVPTDGFHLPLDVLRARSDGADAVYRSGASDTFDPEALRRCLCQIRGDDGAAVREVLLPGFDHGVGEPIAGAHRFVRQVHKIVLVEGLYLLHDADGWEGVGALFDHRIYIDADIEKAIVGIKERNKIIPGYTLEEIEIRCDRVDRKNAITVRGCRDRADIIVASGPAPPGAG